MTVNHPVSYFILTPTILTPNHPSSTSLLLSFTRMGEVNTVHVFLFSLRRDKIHKNAKNKKFIFVLFKINDEDVAKKISSWRKKVVASENTRNGGTGEFICLIFKAIYMNMIMWMVNQHWKFKLHDDNGLPEYWSAKVPSILNAGC